MKTFYITYRCLHALLSISSLKYRAVEVQLNTFLMSLDKTQMVGFTAQPLYPKHQLKRKQEQPQRCFKMLWRDRKLFLLPTVEAKVPVHAIYSPVTNLHELFHPPFHVSYVTQHTAQSLL
jgi:hypothetical protein